MIWRQLKYLFGILEELEKLMPTYTYRCKNCGHEFDVRQRMSDAPLKVCPECQGPVRRVVGSVGVVFKGSGFYVTDHRNSNGGGRVQTSTDGKSSGSESKADSKPEPKKEKKSKKNGEAASA